MSYLVKVLFQLNMVAEFGSAKWRNEFVHTVRFAIKEVRDRECSQELLTGVVQSELVNLEQELSAKLAIVSKYMRS